ncbi:MAG TPA: response regulator [Terriglobia bacterium]|nr:response regulator [Terriglobia bacterium]
MGPHTVSRRILIIDDEEDIREIAQVSLEAVTGWEAITAASADEGMEKAEREQPDAVLLDVQMPDMDGPATFRLLRASPSTSRIPVIMLTAKVQAADRRLLAGLGVAGVIPKPFDPMKLAAEVARVLGWVDGATSEELRDGG